MPSGFNLTFSARELSALDQRLLGVGKVVDKPVLKRILASALKPEVAVLRRNTPVGKRAVKSIATFKAKSGKIKRDGTYDRGGALARSARVLTVDGNGTEQAAALLGYSKKRGQAGWRAHFITRGTANRTTRKTQANRGRVQANDTLAKTEREVTPRVVESVARATEQIIQKTLNRP